MADEASTKAITGITPSQTVGPFFHDALLDEDQTRLVPEDHVGAIRIRGRVYDGAGEPVPDAMVEVWQADPEGLYHHPADTRGGVRDQDFTGFGRCGTDAGGGFEFVTVKPGPVPGSVPGPDDSRQAPHILVSVFARGLLRRLATRIYFPDEQEANAADPVLLSVEERRGQTLIATAEERALRFDVRLQDGPEGEPETVFFDV